MYQPQLQRCQDTITYLRTRYLDQSRNPGKDDIIIIVRKHYIAIIQRRKRYVKLRWFDRHLPDLEAIEESAKPNSIHAFNRFEEEGQADQNATG